MPSSSVNHETADSTMMMNTPGAGTVISKRDFINDYLDVNGSFLKIDNKNSQLVDISGHVLRDPQTVITGMRQFKDVSAICAKDTPW